MTDLPDSGPTITRLHVEHDQEAEVRLHCATFKSRPKSELSWHINDIPTDQLREFGVSVDAVLPTLTSRLHRPIMESNALSSTLQSTQSIALVSSPNDLQLFNSSSFLRLDARKLASKLAKLRHTLQYQPDISNRINDGPIEPGPLDGLSEQFKQNLLFGAQEMDQLRITCKAVIRHIIEQSSNLKIIESGSPETPKYVTGMTLEYVSDKFLFNFC